MNIGILGTGTWGMALGRMLSNAGHDVTMWSALPAEIEALSAARRHPNLPDMVVPAEIDFTGDIALACAGRDLIVFAVPSVFVRSTAEKAAPHIPDGQVVVDVAKGIEPGTLFTMTQVLADVLRADGRHDRVRCVALSGPTHAEEVARDMLTTIVAACEDGETARRVQRAFSTDFMRVYTNVDVLGIELAGALKNIVALASGVAQGLGYGDNARAALITRGAAETLSTASGAVAPSVSANTTSIVSSSASAHAAAVGRSLRTRTCVVPKPAPPLARSPGQAYDLRAREMTVPSRRKA